MEQLLAEELEEEEMEEVEEDSEEEEMEESMLGLLEEDANTTTEWDSYKDKRKFCLRVYQRSQSPKKTINCYGLTRADVPAGMDSKCLAFHTGGIFPAQSGKIPNGWFNQCMPCREMYGDRCGDIICIPGMVSAGPGKKRAISFRCEDECNLKRCHGGVHSAQSNAMTACESDTAYC